MKIGIQYSGGKDSTALLYLMRPKLAEAVVYFADPGIYPHRVKFVHDTCDKLDATLKVVKPMISLEDYHATHGLPADIVPMEASAEMRPYSRRTGPILQSGMACCKAMLFLPLHHAMMKDGVDHVYRGSKAADEHIGVKDGFVENGITYHSPLWSWTDDDVFGFLDVVRAGLPEDFADYNNSFDCVLCTAFLKSAKSKERIEFTKKHYPEMWPKLKARLNTVRQIVDEERAAISGALMVAE